MGRKRKTSDDTFYVTRRIGRLLGHSKVLASGDRLAVWVTGSTESMTLLTLLELRHRWVPVRTELVPFMAIPGGLEHQAEWSQARDLLDKLCEGLGLGLEQQVWPVTESGAPQEPRTTAVHVARALDCGFVAVEDTLDDRAAGALGAVLFEGRVSPTPEWERIPVRGHEAATLIRPLALVSREAVSRAAADNGVPLDRRAPSPFATRRQRDLDWLETLLERAPGERLDLLANLANSPQRVQEGHLL